MLRLSGFSPFILRENGVKEYLFTGLSASVIVGQCIGILGPNGSGKSTLFKAIVGLHEHFDGELQSDAGNEKTLLMNQNYRQSILPWLSVSQHMSRALTEQQHNKANQFLDRMEFTPKGSQVLRDLSGGELQILILSTLLAKKPDLLLLDEPLSAIDFRRRKKATEVLLQYREANNSAMLIVSHSLSDLKPLCEEAFIISGQRSDKIKSISINSRIEEQDVFEL